MDNKDVGAFEDPGVGEIEGVDFIPFSEDEIEYDITDIEDDKNGSEN